MSKFKTVRLKENEIVCDRIMTSYGVSCKQINEKIKDSNYEIDYGNFIYLKHKDTGEVIVLDFAPVRTKGLKTISKMINYVFRNLRRRKKWK